VRASDACTILAISASLAISTGCGSIASKAWRQGQASHLRTLALFYGSATSALGRAPANEAELKKFIEKQGAAAVASLKLASIDKLFVSERDGKPYVVMYGPRPKGAAADLAAYEQDGVDGKRLVGFTLGAVQEVDEQRFRELVPVDAAARPK
jgi:hypothetical protein